MGNGMGDMEYGWIRGSGYRGDVSGCVGCLNYQIVTKFPNIGKCLFHRENGFLKNVCFILSKWQTGLPKMTARTVRIYNVFIKKSDLSLFLQVKFPFFMKTLIFIFLYNKFISSGNHVLTTDAGCSCIDQKNHQSVHPMVSLNYVHQTYLARLIVKSM